MTPDAERNTPDARHGDEVRPTVRPARGLDMLNRITAALAVTLFAALTAVVSLQVLTRFVLHIPFIWSEEVARFRFFWTVLLGAAMSVRSRRHFVLDVSMGRAGPARGMGRLLLDVLPHLCVLGFSVLLLVQGVAYARAGLLRTATNSNVDMGLVFAAIPVFAVLTIIHVLANLLADVRAFRRGQPPAGHEPQAGE